MIFQVTMILYLRCNEVLCIIKQQLEESRILMRKLVAFDYDGVLVDSMTLNRHITNSVCRELVPEARSITQEDIENLNHMSFQEVAAVIGVPDNMIPDCLKLINKRLVEEYSSLSLFDGIPELIDKLAKDGHIIAVVTHNTEKAVNGLLKRYNIADLFSAICGVETPGEKSDKLTALHKEFDIPHDSIFMIGDSVGDINAAKVAGTRSVAVGWGFQSIERLQSCNPDFVVERPEDIERIVNS